MSGDEYPKIVIKPWGKENLIELNDRYAFKEIVMNAGTRSSLQLHTQKLETIYVVSGRIRLEKIDKDGTSSSQEYGPNEYYTIPFGVKHRVEVLQDARLFEVSTPELNDVIRYDDDYGREK